MNEEQILVVDLGSQYTRVIERTIRELGYRSAVLPPSPAKKWLATSRPMAIILSGGSASIYETGSPQAPKEILSLGVPILGICYGMQWLTDQLGGIVKADREKKEYGETKVVLHDTSDKLFKGLTGKHIVWASHGDSIAVIPPGFSVLAESSNGQTIAAISNPKAKIWGIQFHPEVTHTENGKAILDNFLSGICGCRSDWIPSDIIADIRGEVLDGIGEKKAIIGFSGGVDSSIVSAMLAPVLGKQLQAVCIDTGALRQDEIKEIRSNARAAGVRLKIVRASRRFQKALKGKTDAEKKRKAFKKLYVRILEEAAQEFGAEFIIQGSLATDYIESRGVGEATLIKSHHNIGNKWRLAEIHPIRRLFKYEVRALARDLGLPPSITERQPFPGPGLFIRIIGTPVTLAKLSILKEADAMVTRILKEQGIYDQLSQLIVALIGVKTVGIKGDGRSYAYSIVVRGVQTRDFMTVSGFHFPPEIQKMIEKALTRLKEVNRVWFDATDKPPATTEME